MRQHPFLPSLIRTRRARLMALLLLVILPALLLRKSLVGGEVYVPFDISTFPPASVGLEPEEIAQRRAGANWDITEKTMLCVPEYRLAREEILEGRFPHWNPYVRTGAPLFANALAGLAYPLHWPFLFLDPEGAFGFIAWLSFALAGGFMFGFLREVGLTLLPALFGAIVFQLSGTLAANGHFFMRMEALVWLPAGFWALERLFKQTGFRRIPSFCALALSLGSCWLVGFPPYALACSMAFGFYALALTFRRMRKHGFKAGCAQLGWTGFAVAAGIGIAAVQLIPMLDYYPEAQRQLDQSVIELSAQGFDPIGWLGYVMPHPFGGPLQSADIPYDRNPLIYRLWSRSNYLDGTLHYPTTYNYTEYAVYLGAVPLVCMLLSVFRGSVRFRYFAIPAFIFFVAFASGGLLFRTIYLGADSLSAMLGMQNVFGSGPPSRFAGVACFFGAALAATGLEVGESSLSILKHRLTLGISIGLGLLCLVLWFWAHNLQTDTEHNVDRIVAQISAHWRSSYPEVAKDTAMLESWFGPVTLPALAHFASQALYGAAAFGLVTIWMLLAPADGRQHRTRAIAVALVAIFATGAELFVLASQVNPSFPKREIGDTPVDRFLREQRIARRAQGGFTVARIGPKGQAVEPTALPPNLLVPEHIRDLNSYAFLDSRSWRPFEKLYGASQMIRSFWIKSLPSDDKLDLGLLDLFGVRYLLSTTPQPQLGKPAIPPLEGPGGSFWVYERKTALPRAFLVPRAKRVENDNAAVATLISKQFDPSATVLLHDVAAGEELAACAHPEAIAKAGIKFVADNPSRVQMFVNDSPGAWLVLADTAMAHWNLTIDAAETPWRRADLCFRAVWVPPGDHEVEFRYDASPFRKGLGVSAFVLAAMLLMMIWWNGHPKKRAHDIVDTGTETA